jgi:hypothetical protein
MPGRFTGTPFLRQAEISVLEVQAFWAVTKRYAELTRPDRLMHRVTRVLLMDFSISSKRNVSAFQATLFEMLNPGDRLFPGYDIWPAGLLRLSSGVLQHFQHRSAPLPFAQWGSTAGTTPKRYSSLHHAFSATPNAICFQERLHGGRNFYNVCLCRKMSAIEELDLCVRQVFTKRLCSRGNENGIILAPDRKQRWLRSAKIFLKLGIELHI